MSQSAVSRRFVPAEIDLADWAQLEPLYQTLLQREPEDAAALEAWLLDASELTAVVSEFGARVRIEQACHTEDPEVEKRFLHYVEQIAPKLQPQSFAMQQKLLASPHLAGLKARDAERYAVLIREWENDVALFREANIPLQTQVTKKASAYDKLIGAMLVTYQEKEYTLQQLARFQEETDRSVREATWRLSNDRRLVDREAIDGLFSELVQLREQIAANADCANYRDYAWKAFGRFDYGPQEADAFADAIEAVCMPLVRELDAQRRDALGVAALRPWDTAVDVFGRAPLQPFGREDIPGFLEKTRRIFERIDPALAADFARLQPGRNLDLESRRGKRAGGFQSSLAESREPFIFMNAAGLQRDVETLLHEGGHAFHFVWAAQCEPLVFLQHAPIEFCEVASMSMELMGDDHLAVFYGEDEAGQAAAGRAVRQHLEGIIRLLPWVATIDQFQHWLYTHPGHSSAERQAAWLSVLDRFSSGQVDWQGLEDARAWMWQRQLHLFHHPFYYIEYGIAQLGALQLWRRYRQDSVAALRDYRAALSLGGSRPLPELFEAAGIRFSFTRQTLQPLIEDLRSVLATLPQ